MLLRDASSPLVSRRIVSFQGLIEVPFSVVDIVGVLNEESVYTRTRNYWKYLKAKLKKENSQLVSATTQLKLTAADGKKYNTDMLDSP